MGSKIHDNQQAVEIQANAITLRSMLVPSARGGRLDAPVAVTGAIFRFTREPLPPEHLNIMHVLPDVGTELGRTDRAEFKRLYNANVLQPVLRMASQPALRALNVGLELGLSYFDNYMMYAKMFYWAIVLELYNSIHHVPAATDYPVGDDHQFINLDDASLNPTIMPDALCQGRIMLLEGTDYNADDLQALLLLCKPGFRVDGPPVGGTLNASYLHWPAIPVTVLMHGGAPAIPAAQIVPALSLYAFITKLAAQRHEWDSCMRGMYLAFDLLGIQYVLDGQDYYPILSNLSTTDVYIPAPYDYNFMLRILGLYPNTNEASRVEVQTFLARRSVDRVRICTLYSACLSTFTTTTLYSLNIPVRYIIAWGMGLALPPLIVQVFNSGLLVLKGRAPNSEAIMLSQPKKGYKVLLGVNVCQGLYPSGRWNGNYGGNHIIAHSFHLAPPQQPPRLVNPLVIDNWLIVRPMEWGICAPRPSVNLRPDLSVAVAPEIQGWYANQGSCIYAERAKGTFPAKLSVYGVQALNVICEYLAVGAPLLISEQTAYCRPNSEAVWSIPAPIPVGNFTYMPALHIIEPATLCSFNWELNRVLAPCYVNPNIAYGELISLSHLVGQPLENAGIALNVLANKTTPAVFDFRSLAGFSD
jgi:hypothetical protein